jgi:hypothetical protein
MLRRVDSSKLTDISEVLSASIIRALSTTETSVSFYAATRRNIPEDGHLHIRCLENLNSPLTASPFLSQSDVSVKLG